jgi:hypothetical protein
MHPTEQLRSVEEALERFKACIRRLPAADFTRRMHGWAPRDVVAHLIGWNRYTVDGCREILDGRKPAYLGDAANDFSNVNAVSVRRYSSRDRESLLEELDRSFAELRAYLESVDVQLWETHPGVAHEKWMIGARDSLDALGHDYDAHREEIERWAAALEDGV